MVTTRSTAKKQQPSDEKQPPSPEKQPKDKKTDGAETQAEQMQVDDTKPKKDAPEEELVSTRIHEL